MHQHGVVVGVGVVGVGVVVVRVVGVGVVGQVRVERGSVSELGGVRGHLMRVGVSMRGHAHAHRTALRYVLPWHAWQTWKEDEMMERNEFTQSIKLFSHCSFDMILLPLTGLNLIQKTTWTTKSLSDFMTLHRRF